MTRRAVPTGVQRVLFLAGLLALWHLLGVLGLWPPYVFPTLQGVSSAIARGIGEGTLTRAVAGSLGRLATGYGIALAAGLSVGLLMSQLRWFRNTFGMLVLGLQTLPSICWLPLAILWFGLSEKAIVFVVVMGAFLSIALATEDGIRGTPPVYVKAARNLGAGGLRLFRSVTLPAALPAVVTGMKMGWSFAWRSLMAGELIYSVSGLGSLLVMGRELSDMSRVLAVIIVIMLLGLVTDKLVFAGVERLVLSRRGLSRR